LPWIKLYLLERERLTDEEKTAQVPFLRSSKKTL
jgi:hypothetical protein